MAAPPPPAAIRASGLAPLGASRLLIFGGVSLILAGMVFGDIFAVFVLHQNANRIGVELLAATRAVAAGDAGAAGARLRDIGGFLENRGTKVDAHAHMIAFGYLGLLLALLQPYVAGSERVKKQLAAAFVLGAWLLPVGVFLIHYVGLTYSPLQSIGWASIAADFGGLLVIAAGIGEIIGLGRGLRESRHSGNILLQDRSRAGRMLLTGGALLVLAGFLHGAWYSWSYLYAHEQADRALLAQMIERSAAGRLDLAAQTVNDYGGLQAEKAIHIAAHTHIIDFGVLAMLLAFVQPLVYLSEGWKQRWAALLLAGSVILPVCVLAELRLGLVAGGIADAGGLLVVIALTAMLVGVVRHTGALDGAGGRS
jgi:hypothetical protein